MTPRGPHAAPAPTRPTALSQPARATRQAAPATPPDDGHAPPSRTPGARLAWNAPRADDPALIRILVKEANRRGHQMQEMAQALGCTYGYIAQLRTGHRKPEHIGQEFADKVAAYLGVPTALVKLMAGRVTLQDFVWPQRDPQQDMAECLEALRDDPVVGSYVPQSLFAADPEVQQFVWRLYSECADLHPTPSRVLPRMLEYLQRAAFEEAEYEVELAELRDAMGRPGANVKGLS